MDNETIVTLKGCIDNLDEMDKVLQKIESMMLTPEFEALASAEDFRNKYRSSVGQGLFMMHTTMDVMIMMGVLPKASANVREYYDNAIKVLSNDLELQKVSDEFPKSGNASDIIMWNIFNIAKNRLDINKDTCKNSKERRFIIFDLMMKSFSAKFNS